MDARPTLIRREGGVESPSIEAAAAGEAVPSVAGLVRLPPGGHEPVHPRRGSPVGAMVSGDATPSRARVSG
jgi:hypothetical protein